MMCDAKQLSQTLAVKLVTFCVSGLGVQSLLAALAFCYASFATNDYRPIVPPAPPAWAGLSERQA
jgi:hypothetical protein